MSGGEEGEHRGEEEREQWKRNTRPVGTAEMMLLAGEVAEEDDEARLDRWRSRSWAWHRRDLA